MNIISFYLCKKTREGHGNIPELVGILDTIFKYHGNKKDHRWKMKTIVKTYIAASQIGIAEKNPFRYSTVSGAMNDTCRASC